MTFDEVFKLVIGHEGGYVNDPQDPGGETKYGVSKRAYPNEDIKNLTLTRAKEIYKNDYWRKAKCNELPSRLRYIHFDTAVNMGIAAANKILQKACRVKPDGIIGPQTIAASTMIDEMDYGFQRALRYMSIVGNNKVLAKYSKGWANRLKDVVYKTYK